MRGIIFDLDGTLLESMEVWQYAGDRYLRSIGITPPSDLRGTLMTMSTKEAAAYFIQTFNLHKTVSEVVDGIYYGIKHSYKYDIELKSSVRETLEKLHARNIRMCIATATDRHIVETALPRLGIDKYFEFLITCTESGAGKTEPKIYFDATERLGLNQREVVVVEDALYAVKTAKAAGFHVVGIHDRFSKQDESEISRIADRYIHSLEEILD